MKSSVWYSLETQMGWLLRCIHEEHRGCIYLSTSYLSCPWGLIRHGPGHSYNTSSPKWKSSAQEQTPFDPVVLPCAPSHVYDPATMNPDFGVSKQTAICEQRGHCLVPPRIHRHGLRIRLESVIISKTMMGGLSKVAPRSRGCHGRRINAVLAVVPSTVLGHVAVGIRPLLWLVTSGCTRNFFRCTWTSTTLHHAPTREQRCMRLECCKENPRRILSGWAKTQEFETLGVMDMSNVQRSHWS